MRSIRKVKILGYPFAGGQGKSGVELTPSWLQNQKWFKSLASNSNGMITYEEIKVTDPNSNTTSRSNKFKNDQNQNEPKNIENVLRSSMMLR